MVDKLKDDNPKLANNFKNAPPGRGKYKGKGKVKGNSQKKTGKKFQYGKVKEERKKQDPKDGETNTKKVNIKT